MHEYHAYYAHACKAKASKANISQLACMSMTAHKPFTGDSDRQGLSQTLSAFKQYLDASGSLLASDPNLLAYYALPYVRDPQSHPSFRHIFTPTFVSDLRQQLSNALQSVPSKQPLPRLYAMYAAAQASSSVSASASQPFNDATLAATGPNYILPAGSTGSYEGGSRPVSAL